MDRMSVVLIAPEGDDRSVLQMQIDATAVAKTAQVFSAFPVTASDPLMRRLRELHADIVVVDVHKQSATSALRCIELLATEFPGTSIFAYGDTSHPQTIVAAMRAGAREYLERPTTVPTLLDALVRVSAVQRSHNAPSERGKIFTFVNTKGGSGATTVAVNTALALSSGRSVAIVDLAPLGHVCIHLNVKPTFTLVEALANVERLDRTLLETYLITHATGVKVLAASDRPNSDDFAGPELAHLFDLLVTSFEFVIVDLSSRLDKLTKPVCDLSDRVVLVAQPDVPSLWSAAKLNDFLGDSNGNARISLVLNRSRKIPGFDDSDVEAATRLRVVQRIPSQFHQIAGCIDRGIPVTQQNHSELSRCYVDFAHALSGQTPVPQKRKAFSLFGA